MRESPIGRAAVIDNLAGQWEMKDKLSFGEISRTKGGNQRISTMIDQS